MNREQSRAFWAVLQLAHRVEVAESILRGRAVLAGNLDGFWLRHALRGAALPDPQTYIRLTDDMLAAVHEAGPLPRPAGSRR